MYGSIFNDFLSESHSVGTSAVPVASKTERQRRSYQSCLISPQLRGLLSHMKVHTHAYTHTHMCSHSLGHFSACEVQAAMHRRLYQSQNHPLWRI